MRALRTHDTTFIRVTKHKRNLFAGMSNKLLKFRFQTLDEAKKIVRQLADFYPDSETAFYGLHEMVVNAIEHGNLGIGCKTKSKLLRDGGWQQEIERRMAMKKNADKYVQLTFEKTASSITVRIKDQGDGFDWKPYLELVEHSLAPNGRGIATTKAMSFPELKYNGNGNEVVCTVKLGKK